MSSPASPEDINILDILGQNNDSESSNTDISADIMTNSNAACTNNEPSCMIHKEAALDSGPDLTACYPEGSPLPHSSTLPSCQNKFPTDGTFSLLASDGSILETNIHIEDSLLDDLDQFLDEHFIPPLQLDHMTFMQPITVEEDHPIVSIDHATSPEPITAKEDNHMTRLDHMTTAQPITVNKDISTVRMNPEEPSGSTHIEPHGLSLGEHISDQFSARSTRSQTPESTKHPIEALPICDLDDLQIEALPGDTQTFDLDDLITAEHILDECMDISFTQDSVPSPSVSTFDLDSFLDQSSPDNNDLHTESAFTSESSAFYHDGSMNSTGNDSGVDSGYDSNNTMSPSGSQFPSAPRSDTADATGYQTSLSHNTPGSSRYNDSAEQNQLIAACIELQARNTQGQPQSKTAISDNPKVTEAMADEAECSKGTWEDFECNKMKLSGGSKKKDRKPYETYVALIAKAMLASGKMRLTLGEIYDQVGL